MGQEKSDLRTIRWGLGLIVANLSRPKTNDGRPIPQALVLPQTGAWAPLGVLQLGQHGGEQRLDRHAGRPVRDEAGDEEGELAAAGAQAPS